jgi:transposase
MLNDTLISSRQQVLIEQLTAQNQLKDSIINQLSERLKQRDEAYDFLYQQIQELKRKVFGSQSERYIDDPESKQLSLLDDNDYFAESEAKGNIEVDIEVPAHSRKKKSILTKDLPRQVVTIKIPEQDMICGCGTHKRVFKTEVKEILHYIPAVFEIIEQHREVASCPTCKDGLVTAPAPLQILPKVAASEEFLSYLAVSKVEDRQPLYHLEQKLKLYGVDCSRQNMSRWLIDLTIPLRPIYNLLKDQIINYDIASSDATSLQVLKEPGRNPETKSDVYCFRGGPPDKSVVLYDYNAIKHQEFVKDWFLGFNGYLHVDADNCFSAVGSNGAILSLCNAHARRKFEPIAKATKGQGVAKEAMRYFQKLYKVEREAKDKNLTSSERYQLRQEKSKPIYAEFNAWLDKIAPTVLPKSTLGIAVSYCIKHRQGLIQFLNDGRVEIDNNLTEQSIKPFVINRKGFMFCDTVAGANALCLHYGLIKTAKLHNLNPYEYYVSLLKKIPLCQTVEDYEQLLPWNIVPILKEQKLKD